MDSPLKFLMTNKKESADKLKSLGFECIIDTDNFWEFINNEKIKFSNIDGVHPTNKMLF